MKMIIEAECRMCGKQFRLKAEKEDIHKWMNGMNNQDALPYMPAEERELLISGTCPECWNKLFPAEEEE